MKRKRLTGPHKVAVILRMLDEEVAQQVVQRLGDQDLARIHRADTDLADPDEDVVREVLQDFRARVFGAGSGLAGIQGRRVDSLIRNTVDKQRLDAILGRTDTDIGKIQDTLAGVDARIIARILSREYPQTCALVLSQLPAIEAAEVMLSLPDEFRTDVLMRIARMEKISEEMLAELNRAIQREIQGFEASGQAQEMAGVDVAVQLLMNMDRASEGKLLESVEELDAEIASMIRERMFTFDDLLEVDNRGIQQLLRNIESRTLVLALKGTGDAMREKFLSNVSQRVADSLREDLETMGPVRLSEVEAAQQQIANTARGMVERGEIMVAGWGDDELV